MRIQFLGTGTSVGVPAIGCGCAVCRSTDPRNKRRRASLHIVAAGLNLIVDTPPDFRDAVLACGVPRVDAVLLTHSHADHVFGFDDIRRFCDVHNMTIPVHGSAATIADMNRFFPYVHQKAQPGLSYPRVEFRVVEGPFMIGDVRIEPLPVEHATVPTVGYRFEADGAMIAYVPDCRAMAPAVEARLRGLDLLILDALRRRPHPTHYSLQDSVVQLHKLGARQSFITHMGHDLDHEQTQTGLPAGIAVPYDGLEVEVTPF